MDAELESARNKISSLLERAPAPALLAAAAALEASIALGVPEGKKKNAVEANVAGGSPHAEK